MLSRVKEFVTESFGKEHSHLERTLYWVKELEPDASEELLIAAMSHDIERAFNPEAKEKKEFNTEEETEEHEVEGGKIMFEFLIKAGYDSERAQRVRELISRHEVGGDREQDLLKDADSLSWLEVSAPKHIGRKSFSKEQLEKKVAFMFERISSREAKRRAAPFYDQSLELLEKLV